MAGHGTGRIADGRAENRRSGDQYRFGAARGSRCVVGIFPGTGIGGGCVYEGRILRGNGITCMEIGHFPINPGAPARGNNRCHTLEHVSSRLAIAAAWNRNDVELPQGDFVTDLVRSRISYDFSTRLFLAALIQYDNQTEHHQQTKADESFQCARQFVNSLLQSAVPPQSRPT